jgi:hypothetical protein
VVVLVDPAALLPNVHYLQKGWVEASFLKALLEGLPVHVGSAASENDPVEFPLLHHVFDVLDGGARAEV